MQFATSSQAQHWLMSEEELSARLSSALGVCGLGLEGARHLLRSLALRLPQVCTRLKPSPPACLTAITYFLRAYSKCSLLKENPKVFMCFSPLTLSPSPP